MTIRKYTWKPDLPDHRDYRFADRIATPLPPSVDLTSKCPPIYDQGQLGSCTANALAAAVEFLHPGLMGSRLFIYYNERQLEGTTGQDAGAMIRDGVKTLNQQGVCPESEWPYSTLRFTQRPSSKCYVHAKQHTISVYQRLATLDDMLHCLAAGFPFVFGFTVYDAFESPEVASTGVLNMPASGESPLGGHAVLAVGYDQASKRIRVRNSWGNQWGQAGYFTMPYDYVGSTSLADDLWTIRK